jgi:hypothetical protein
MATAKILRGGWVIKIDNLSANIKQDLDGFLVEFTIGGDTYIHRNRNDFKTLDITSISNQLDNKYYKKAIFLMYYEGKASLIEVKESELANDKRIKIAEKGDKIVVTKLFVQTPYLFYEVYTSTFIYNGNSVNVLKVNGDINFPPDTLSQSPVKINANINANNFFESRKGLINMFPNEKDRAALLITKIGLLINMINEDIFPLFNIGGIDYSAYVDAQNLEWQNGSIFIQPTLVGLQLFLDGLTEYYSIAYKNQNNIALSSGIEKLYWFAMLLTPSSLSSLPPQSKLDLLEFICKYKLSSIKEKIPEENLVINILLSFSPNNISQIDGLLAHLITFPILNSNQSIYEILYSKLSTSTNIKEGLLGLSNWVFKTDFKPTKTKEQFVQAVYALWQLSKFNPYGEDGSIKQDSIGFKILNADTAKYDNIANAPSTTFTYSYEVSYKVISQPNSHIPEINDISYQEVYKNAAPILFPYESEKFAGVFFDNFNFRFDGAKITATQTFLLGIEAVNGGIGTIGLLKEKKQDVLYGTYDIYQPVSLLSTNIETKSALSTVNGNNIVVNGNNINSLIPIFVLKFIDDAGDRSDAETVIGYVVDVVTTYAGIGALAKLKHLRWAATGAETVGLFTLDGLRLVVGGVEFTSGVLGFFANFVECDPNNSFCNGVKTFIIALQLASLTINATDSLATFAMRRSAGRVIEEAGGANEAEIVQNIKDRLIALNASANVDTVGEAANAIYRSGRLYSFPANIFASIERTVKGFISSSRNIGKFVLHSDYTNSVIHNFIERCLNLNVDQRVITDLLIFANRKAKYINPEQLLLRLDYMRALLKRGYTAGFESLTQFNTFGRTFKNKFLDNLDLIGGGFDEFLESMEVVVKGSATQTWKTGDEIINGITRPLREADDIDIAIRLTRKDYLGFRERLKEVIEDYDLLTKGQKNGLRGQIDMGTDMLKYDNVFKKIPIANSNYYYSIADACEPFTRFKKEGNIRKITFSIILKDGLYDNFPELLFKL